MIFFFFQPEKKNCIFYISQLDFGRRACLSPSIPPQDRCSSVHTREHADFTANGFCCLVLMGLCTEVLLNTEGAAAAAPEARRLLCVRARLSFRDFLGWGCEVTSREDGKRGWLYPGGDWTCL